MTPAAEPRKVVERVDITDNHGYRMDDRNGRIFKKSDGWRFVAERLEPEPSEFELAARLCDAGVLRNSVGVSTNGWPEADKAAFEAAGDKLREADRRLKEQSK